MPFQIFLISVRKSEQIVFDQATHKTTQTIRRFPEEMETGLRDSRLINTLTVLHSRQLN